MSVLLSIFIHAFMFPFTCLWYPKWCLSVKSILSSHFRIFHFNFFTVDYGWGFIKNSLFRVNMNESQQVAISASQILRTDFIIHEDRKLYNFFFFMLYRWQVKFKSIATFTFCVKVDWCLCCFVVVSLVFGFIHLWCSLKIGSFVLRCWIFT